MSLTQVQDVSVHDIHKRAKPSKHYVYFMRVYWRDGPITSAYRSYSTILELQERLLKIEDFLLQQKETTGQTKNGAFLRGKPFFERFTIKKKAKALKRMPCVEEFLQCVVHLPPHIAESDPVINFFHPLPEDLMQLDDEQSQLYDLIERNRSRSKHVHHISEPFLLEQYIAISDYTKSQVSDINLRTGHVVDVIEKNDHGWWFVDLDGEVGWVPASYLEPRDGTLDDQILESFEEGEEETCITMAEYEPVLEDEVGFEMGKVVKVVQKNLDGWCLVRFGEREGWAPSMYLREVATTTNNAKQRQQEVRNMLRDQRSISAMTGGRRQTWVPPMRRKSVQRKDSRPRVKQTESTNTEENGATKPARSYVNLEFLEKKQKPAGRQRSRPKLDPNEVRAKVMAGNQINETKQNKDLLSVDESLRPRPLSFVEEENVVMVSRGTSPIPSPLLRRQSSSCSSNSSASGDGDYQTLDPVSRSERDDTGDQEFDTVPRNDDRDDPVSRNDDGDNTGNKDLEPFPQNDDRDDPVLRSDDRDETGNQEMDPVLRSDDRDETGNQELDPFPRNDNRDDTDYQELDLVSQNDDRDETGNQELNPVPRSDDRDETGSQESDPFPRDDDSDVETKMDSENTESVPTVALCIALETRGTENEEVDLEEEGHDFTENMPDLMDGNRYYVTGSYEKENELEVNLKENTEVELLEESEGGWWLVRTSSHSVGWAPSNYLEKILRRHSDDLQSGEEPSKFRRDFRPERPPKSPRALKMAQDVCVEKRFWSFIKKGKELETCPLEDEIMSSKRANGSNSSSESQDSLSSELYFKQSDDYECDLDTGVCRRKTRKSSGGKADIPRFELLKVSDEENNNNLERSESVPSLAESEDFDSYMFL